MPDDHPILDLMQHQRAVRLFAAGDVDDATVERLIDAATRAPSSRNSPALAPSSPSADREIKGPARQDLR